jgi:Transcriptional regulatory protein, C terminal
MVVVYNKTMKELKNILFSHLPPALSKAIGAQLPDEIAAGDHPCPDLVIALQPVPDAACPVLLLETVTRARLGDILRRIAHILSDPVLHLSDMPLGAWLFRPQEKALQAADGATVALTDRENAIIACLARHRGSTVAREVLLRDVWRYQKDIDTHTLETHVYRLRQKLEPVGPSLVVTEDGGYRIITRSATETP